MNKWFQAGGFTVNAKMCDDEAITREEEYQRIVDSFFVLNIPQEIQSKILDALNSDEWDWFKDCDGCTCVNEQYWPTRYFPPCLRHDYLWHTGRGGFSSNRELYRVSRAYGMERWRCVVRTVGTDIGWVFRPLLKLLGIL